MNRAQLGIGRGCQGQLKCLSNLPHSNPPFKMEYCRTVYETDIERVKQNLHFCFLTYKLFVIEFTFALV